MLAASSSYIRWLSRVSVCITKKCPTKFERRKRDIFQKFENFEKKIFGACARARVRAWHFFSPKNFDLKKCVQHRLRKTLFEKLYWLILVAALLVHTGFVCLALFFYLLVNCFCGQLGEKLTEVFRSWPSEARSIMINRG